MSQRGRIASTVVVGIVAYDLREARGHERFFGVAHRLLVGLSGDLPRCQRSIAASITTNTRCLGLMSR